ncbi:unnamed protein product [Phaeothamnion confervicola]
MAPPLFADLAKPVTSLLDDDYSLKRLLKTKHTTPHGAAVTVENELKKGGGVAGKVSVKYMHKPWQLSCDKLTLKPDGATALETSYVGAMPGLKLLATVEAAADLSKKGKGDFGLEYATARYLARAEVDSDMTRVKSSATVSFEPFTLAGALTYKVPGEKQAVLSEYGAGVSAKRGAFFAALTTADKFGKYNAALLYTHSPAVSGALLASVVAQKGSEPRSVSRETSCCCGSFCSS